MRIPVTILSLLFFCHTVLAQETVFNGLRSDVKRADNLFEQGHYQEALDLYQSAEKKGKGGSAINIKIARTYNILKDYQKSALYFDKHLKNGGFMAQADYLQFAEVLQATGDYERAVEYFKIYLETNPKDRRILERVWRLNNIEYLLEDSVFYTVNPSGINTDGTEYGPVFYEDGLVYVGDKQIIGGVSVTDGANERPFQTLYFSQLSEDSLKIFTGLKYKLFEPERLDSKIKSSFNISTPAFYKDDRWMVFTKNGPWNKKNGSTLRLCFAAKTYNGWNEVGEFSYNSEEFSNSHPWIDNYGKVLYFVSDRPGGYGGKDIYVSYNRNNRWTTPENMGSRINTPGDEVFPYVHDSTLYFSSNGHSGFGGLDIFKIDLSDLEKAQVVNPGYPINTSYDDFGIALNEKGTRGFISSNRGTGGFNDDIFEIEIDLQSYPLIVDGIVKFKEFEWQDTDKFELLGNAELTLTDVRRGTDVAVTVTDANGVFKLEIPYASQYSIRIWEEDLGEYFVSFVVPKNKKKGEVHDIVLVKNGGNIIDGNYIRQE